MIFLLHSILKSDILVDHCVLAANDTELAPPSEYPPARPVAFQKLPSPALPTMTSAVQEQLFDVTTHSNANGFTLVAVYIPGEVLPTCAVLMYEKSLSPWLQSPLDLRQFKYGYDGNWLAKNSAPIVNLYSASAPRNSVGTVNWRNVVPAVS